MAKLKLTLPTGTVEEKSLINAFKVDNASYVVFDAESVGSMGLPIILVSKFDNNRLTKIVDANEWTSVKGHLKNIIAGTKMEFIPVSDALEADEVYYTQLTLPVVSFDALKKAYVPVLPDVAPAVSEPVAPVEEQLDAPVSIGTVENIAPVGPAPVTDNIPEAPITDITPEAPITDIVTESVPETPTPVAPVEIPANETVSANEPVANPLVGDLSELTEKPDAIAETPAEVAPVAPVVEPTPIVETPAQAPVMDVQPVMEAPVAKDYTADKEAFLKACENMFDALVSKFENK